MRHLVYLLLILTFFSACKSSSTITTTDKNNSHLAEKIIHSASENIGVRYKAAGTTKAGFDCSGLIYSTFNLYNIQLPRSSYEQSKLGLIIKQDNAKKGDLIFFKTNKSSRINHVGMVIDTTDEEIKFIHSSSSKGVMISSTKEPYYKNSFAQINRIL